MWNFVFELNTSDFAALSGDLVPLYALKSVWGHILIRSNSDENNFYDLLGFVTAPHTNKLIIQPLTFIFFDFCKSGYRFVPVIELLLIRPLFCS